MTAQIDIDPATLPDPDRLPGVFDSIDTLLLLTDPLGRILWLNRSAALALSGAGSAAPIGRPLWDAPWRTASAEGRERLRRAAAVAAGGRIARDAIELFVDERRRATIDFSLKLLPGSSLAILLFEGRDVTERRQAYDALRESEVRLRSIVETAPDAIIRVDDRGTILSFNPAAEDLFGHAADEIVGRNVKRLLPASEDERFDRYVARYLRRGLRRSRPAPREALGRRKSGASFVMELSVSEIRLGDRRTFTGFIRDVSRRKVAEAKLQQQQAEIAHVMRLNTVVAMASAIGHELNQPLTAIMSCAQACQRMLASSQAVPTELWQAMGMIVAQTQRAGDIIRHVKDFTRKGESLRTEQDINRIVQTAIDFQAQEAQRSGVTIRASLDPVLPPVLVDRIQIEQVVLNLVRNSVQAIDDAEMQTREVSVSTSMNDDNAVQVTVDDTGPGIPSAIAKRLFEPFVTSKMNGMGVGLTICRTIINAHGGRLWPVSKPEGGTSFYFTLPPTERAGGHGG